MSNRQTINGVYTEVDPSSHITLGTNDVTWASLVDTEVAYVYKDFTAGYFAGDFEHQLQFRVNAESGTECPYFWGMSNSVECLGANGVGDHGLSLWWNNNTLTLSECNNSGTWNSDTCPGLVIGTDYYARICRREGEGTYGKLYCYLYSDPEYTALIDTLVVTLTEKADFRYLFAFSAKGSAGGTSSGYCKNLTLDEYPYTLANYRLRLRDLLREVAEGFYLNDELDGWINDGVRDLAEKALCIQHIDSLATTNGVRTVSFSGYRVEAVEYIPAAGNRKALRRIVQKQLGRVPVSSGASVPQYWFENGATFGVEPLPDAVYNLAAYVCDWPAADMTLDTDVPEIPPAFRPLVILFALYKALLKDRKGEAARQIYSIYWGELNFTAYDYVAPVPDSREELGYQ